MESISRGQEGIPNPEAVYKALYGVFGGHQCGAPSCQNPLDREFILEALGVMQLLGVYDRDFFAELMVQFLDGSRDIR